VEFADNPEPRLPFLLLIDTSGSMAGAPIDRLNEALAVFRRNLGQNDVLRRRVELAIVAFSDLVSVEQRFSLTDPMVPLLLQANGTTSTGHALYSALTLIRERRRDYLKQGIPYWRPWLVLLTDGVPTDDWQPAAAEVRTAVLARKLSLLAVGMEGADMEMLGQIAPENQPAQRLRDLDFPAFFAWLTAALN
jgi:uncharacterized protein YegL